MLNTERIMQICEDLYDMTGIKAVFYDADMHIVYSHPLLMGEFCTELRKDPHMEAKCLACDRMGMDGCRKSQDFYIYACHMGLMEATAPVVDDGVVIGYVMFGQTLQSGTKKQVLEQVDKIEDASRRRLLQKALEHMTPTDERKLRAGARMIGMCASYLHLHQMMQGLPDVRSEQVRRMVQTGLSDPKLTDETICRALAISRGTLYHVCKKAFGVGISAYIRKLRVELAVQLISETRMSLQEVSQRCGISDPDYLSRLVRKQTGNSPREIRRKESIGKALHHDP